MIVNFMSIVNGILLNGFNNGKTLFQDVSVRVFPEEISIGISRLSKGDHPPPVRWAAANL